MFPKPKRIDQHITHSECEAVIKRGCEEPYDFSKLYQAPSDYTYEGKGKEFEEYVKGLRREGKDFNMWRYMIFLKKELLADGFSYCLGCFSSFLLPLTMEAFLRWIKESDSKPGRGLFLLVLSFVLIFFRLVGILLANWYEKVAQILSRNILEVRIIQGFKGLLNRILRFI